MEKFKITCACGNEEIETTMEPDDGYSNWTVLDSGYIEFKCKSCGNFGSTDSNKTDGNNKLDQFTVTCIACGGTQYDFTPADVDGEQAHEIHCNTCNIVESKPDESRR